MNVSVCDANSHIQALTRSRRAIDPETPFEPLAGEPASRS
jgi:hypothetical protein